MFEIFKHIGTLSDFAAIDSVRSLRDLFDRGLPFGWMGRLFFFWSRHRLEAGGDHEFEIPFGKDRVGIFPVQDFALLGHANLSREAARRLRQDGGVRWPSAAADRSSSAVKKAQLDSIFLCGPMQFAMRLVEFPRAGQHAAVFVGVGVAEHDFLPASPGIEQRLVFGIGPQATHDAARGPQRFDGLEQRNRHQPGIVVGTCDPDAERFRKPNNRQHIAF